MLGDANNLVPWAGEGRPWHIFLMRDGLLRQGAGSLGSSRATGMPGCCLVRNALRSFPTPGPGRNHLFASPTRSCNHPILIILVILLGMLLLLLVCILDANIYPLRLLCSMIRIVCMHRSENQ